MTDRVQVKLLRLLSPIAETDIVVERHGRYDRIKVSEWAVFSRFTLRSHKRKFRILGKNVMKNRPNMCCFLINKNRRDLLCLKH